jgi:tight adherence protein B
VFSELSWTFAFFACASFGLALGMVSFCILQKFQSFQDEQRLSARLRGSVDKRLDSAVDDCSSGTSPHFWRHPIINSSLAKSFRGSSEEDICGTICSVLYFGGKPGRRLLTLLDGAGLRDHKEATLQWWLALVVFLSLFAWAWNSFLAAAVVLCLLTIGGITYLQVRSDKRRQALREALPNMLDELAQSLRAGRSFPQSLSFVLEAQPEDGVLKGILRRLDADSKLGRSCSESLKELSISAGLRELNSIAAVLEISARVGGATPTLFEQSATSIREDLMLNKKLKVQTAQGRSSVRLVGAVPFVLIGLMSLAMPGYLGLWLSSSGGQALFVFALCLVAVGFLWVRSVVNIYV